MTFATAETAGALRLVRWFPSAPSLTPNAWVVRWGGARARDAAQHLFQTVFQGAKHGGRFFEPGLANYRSILAAGDAAAAEEYEDWVRDAERWRSKVVVDDLNFHAVLHSQARKVPGQTDKGQLMLQDPPMCASPSPCYQEHSSSQSVSFRISLLYTSDNCGDLY